MDVKIEYGVREDGVQTEKEQNDNGIPSSTSKTSAYLLVDHEEELNRQIESLRKDVFEQVRRLDMELERVKDILGRLVLVALPLIAGWILLAVSKLIFSKPYESYVLGINCGIIISVFLLDMLPLNESLHLVYDRIISKYILTGDQTTEASERSDGQRESKEEELQTNSTGNLTTDKQVQTVGDQSADYKEQITPQNIGLSDSEGRDD